MSSTFDLCLQRILLHVIRLAGWLKHCNISLSLSLLLQNLAQPWCIVISFSRVPVISIRHIRWATEHLSELDNA